MSVANNVVFERKLSEGWQPVQFKDLNVGDIARMRIAGGGVLRGEDGAEVYEVVAMRGQDPDTHRHVDMSLFPVKG